MFFGNQNSFIQLFHCYAPSDDCSSGYKIFTRHDYEILPSTFATKQETVFDPVSLTCGHIFCYMCACSAASVSIVDGLKTADPKEKCPLCREVLLLSLLQSISALVGWAIIMLQYAGILRICDDCIARIDRWCKKLALECKWDCAFLLHNLILFLYQLILQAGVYEGAVHLEELNVLLARRYAIIWPSWTRPIKQISYFNKEISSFSSFA